MISMPNLRTSFCASRGSPPSVIKTSISPKGAIFAKAEWFHLLESASKMTRLAERIIAAGHWRDGDPDILVVFDAGYDLTRLAWLLRDLPAEVTGRLRSDRVVYFPALAR